MSSLSATELSRLHRQRRLECSTPIHRVTPTDIKRRSRRNLSSTGASDSVSNDDAFGSNDLSGAWTAYSLDEEVMVTTSNCGSFTQDVGSGNVKSTPGSINAHTSGSNRSQFFSSSTLSVPADTRTFKTPKPQTLTYAVTPPDSPGHRSTACGKYTACSPRRHLSPMPSLGTYLDNRPIIRTPHRPGPGGVSRSNSSRSMPHATSGSSNDAEKSITSGSKHFHDPEMPMDELMAFGSCCRDPRGNRRPPTRNNKFFDASLLAAGTLNSIADDSLALPDSTTRTALAVSGTQSHPSTTAVFTRMTVALQQHTRAFRINGNEEQLEDGVQKMKKEPTSTAETGASFNDAAYWEQKYEQREVEWSEQEKEHDQALRAIQRVLADVSAEREETIARLTEELEVSQQQRDHTILKLTQKLKAMQLQVNAANSGESEHIAQLKSQLECMRTSNAQLMGQRGSIEENDVAHELTLKKQETADVDETNENLKSTKEASEKQSQRIGELEGELKTVQSNSENALDREDLIKALKERTSSLENAKMIIASLENANGSLARDLRAKLKEKEEELATLTSTSADRKRTLDRLATELRELQRQQQKPRLPPKQLGNQWALCQMLEKNVRALRQAAVQHEARNDQSSVDQISQIVSETFSSLKYNLESWEAYLKDEAPEEVADVHINANLQLEAALASKDDEITAVRKELEQLKSDSSQQTTLLHHEVENLKQQLTVNNEALEKRGRELAVLKDSLNLEDNGVGYISDDGTEGYETEPEPISSHGRFSYPTSTSDDFSGSLLLHPSSGRMDLQAAEMSDATAAEILMLKNEIIKQQKERECKAAELQAEKDSLANAKMIISSLEKANKSMLEDLRSRLQDSNTAIASLLEKSMEHEKTIAMLRKELETCRQERDTDEQKTNSLIAKLRDENLIFSMRLAARDREVGELQDTLSQYEGQEVTISKARMSSLEEKKDDRVSD